jgi:polyphenol oxidase
MIVREFGPVLVWFSERTDGDLGWKGFESGTAREAWHRIMTESGYRDLPAPRYLFQVHGADIRSASAVDSGNLGSADALIAKEQGVPIGVFTADCLPVLFWNDHGVVAVHCGWKSTRQGLLAKAARQFLNETGSQPESLKVMMGPCIGQCCLELGEEVQAEFAATDTGSLSCFSRGKKWHLDLRALNALQLVEHGVHPRAIEHVPFCTQCHSTRFFSYRADRGRSGSLFSGILRR